MWNLILMLACDVAVHATTLIGPKLKSRSFSRQITEIQVGQKVWLVYRTFALRAPQRLTWRQVYRQFGLHPDKASDKKTVQNFRVKVLRELTKIKLAWPELNYSTAPGLLILHPSTPAIASLNPGQLGH